MKQMYQVPTVTVICCMDDILNSSYTSIRFENGSGEGDKVSFKL